MNQGEVPSAKYFAEKSLQWFEKLPETSRDKNRELDIRGVLDKIYTHLYGPVSEPKSLNGDRLFVLLLNVE